MAIKGIVFFEIVNFLENYLSGTYNGDEFCNIAYNSVDLVPQRE